MIDDLSIILAIKQQNYGLVPLSEDMLNVILPASQPMARRQSLSVADLKREAWALDSKSSAFGDFIANLCRRSEFEARLNGRCKGFEMVAALVSAGCSVSIVPGLRLVKPIDGVKPIELRPEVRRKISVAYRRGGRNHPAVTVVIEELLRVAAKLLKSDGAT